MVRLDAAYVDCMSREIVSGSFCGDVIFICVSLAAEPEDLPAGNGERGKRRKCNRPKVWLGPDFIERHKGAR